jgi:hypothetical protein
LSLFSVSTIQKTLMAGCGMELTEWIYKGDWCSVSHNRQSNIINRSKGWLHTDKYGLVLNNSLLIT